MKRKSIKVVIAVLAAIVCMFAFAACNKKEDNGNNHDNPDTSSWWNGTYYLYKDGSYDKSDFIKLDDAGWSDKMGMTGFIELNGTSIALKYKSPAIEGLPDPEPITYYGGTIGNGVFREEAYMGIPLVDDNIKYYCKSGKTPSDLPNDSGNNPDNTNGDDQSDSDNPSSTSNTVTFDANGGYCATSTMNFTVGATMQNLPTPTRTGYTFAGWKDSSGNSYDGNSKMPNNNLTLIAQWTRTQKQYSDSYVTFTLAEEGVKNMSTQINYYGDVDKFIYVELKSDDLGGPSKVGVRNNFNLNSVSDLKITKKNNYGWAWYEGYDNLFNTPNGAQRFTLNYGSNIQFLAVDDGSGVVLQTYLVDFYVKQDYNIKLYTDMDAIVPFDTVRVTEGDYFGSNQSIKKVCDFTFDKHVYKVPIDESRLLDYDYSKPVTQDWKLYQTYKEKKITPDLNDGTLEGEISVTPCVKKQQLPVPQKEGYDFIGWKLGNKYFTDKNGNSGVNCLNSTNGNETLTAAFEPKHFYWYNSGDELRTAVATPSISYKDDAKTEIYGITYTYNGATLNNGNTFVAGNTATVTAEKDGYTFVGWYNGDELLTSNIDYKFTVPKNEFIFTKRWTYYTLTTDRNITNGGSITNYYEQKITAGKSVTITANTYSGYTFLGWYNSGTKLSEKLSYTFTMPKANITYTAKWTNCPVTFEKNIAAAGSINAPNTTTMGQPMTVTATTNNGYTWLGWYNGNTRLTADTSYTFTLTDTAVTYTAKWGEYKLTTNVSDTNAGTVTNYSDQRIVAGQSVTLTATTNNGYTWLGWYNGNTRLSTATSYTFNMPSDSVTYTAKWSKVTISSNNTSAGLVTSLNGKYKVGDSVTVTATTNNGYTWVGWYNGSRELTKELSYTFTVPSSNVTYTAKWSKVTVVSDNSEAGSVSSLIDKYSVGDRVTITATSNAGYTFVGWYEGGMLLMTTLSLPIRMTSENVTYTAKWCKVSVTSDNASAGTVTPLDSTYRVGEMVTVTAKPKNGYTFVGWYNGEQELTKELSYTFTMPSSNITYTAKWTYYTFTTNRNNTGAGTVTYYNSTKITAGQSTTVTATTNSGYTWVGWYNGTQELTKEQSYTFTMPSESVTYTAKWSKVNLSRSDTSAGSVTLLNGRYKAGDSVTVTATTNLGYTFVGWYNGEQELTKDLIYTFTMPSSNVTYTAKWKINTEISNFIFSSTPNSLSITGLLDRNIKTIFVPDYTTNINEKAFYGCNGLTSITLPFVGETENGTSNTHFGFIFGASSYSSNNNYVPTSLRTVTVTGGKSIKSNAFFGCNGLTSITISNSVTSIGSSVFEGCDNITSATIPSIAISYIPKTKLQIVVIIGGTSINGFEFRDCSSLMSVTICNSITSIGNYAFDGCSSLTSIVYTGDIKDWCEISGLEYLMPCGSNKTLIIDGKEITGKLVIPNSVTSIGNYAFYDCSSLTSIEIPNSVTSIGDYAFRGCSGLTSIEIPNSVTSIEWCAFYGCSNLMSIEIPNSVTSIDSYAFSDCGSLKCIEIPNSVTDIGYRVFDGCSSLTRITVESGNTTYHSSDNCLIETDSKTLILGCKNSVVSNDGSVTSIGEFAFSGCSSLTSITIPNSVTSIRDSAFYDCSSLTKIEIPNSVTYIGDHAFSGCNSLTSIEIPNGVVSLSNYTFYNCNNLTIYCEATSKPSGWDSYWNCYYVDRNSYKYCPVVWGVK